MISADMPDKLASQFQVGAREAASAAQAKGVAVIGTDEAGRLVRSDRAGGLEPVPNAVSDRR